MVTERLAQHPFDTTSIDRARNSTLGQREAEARAIAAAGCEYDHESGADFLAALRKDSLELARL